MTIRNEGGTSTRAGPSSIGGDGPGSRVPPHEAGSRSTEWRPHLDPLKYHLVIGLAGERAIHHLQSGSSSRNEVRRPSVRVLLGPLPDCPRVTDRFCGREHW